MSTNGYLPSAPVKLKAPYVEPHHKISIEVTQEQIPVVMTEAQKMYSMCFEPSGIHRSAEAIAHSQINDEKPLRLFVTRHGGVIINPKINRHTNAIMLKTEGCMSFPDKQPVPVERFYKIEAEYQTIDDGKLTEKRNIKLKGLEAQIWQHEIDHMNGKYV